LVFRPDHRASTTDHRIRSAGFTFFELMLVVLIMGIVAALSAPMFRGTMATVSLQSGARSVMALATHGRAMASAQALRYCLNFNPDERTFWLTAELDPLTAFDQFDPLPNAWGRVFALPESVSFQRLVRIENGAETPLSGEDAGVMFYPDGTADEAEIVLANDRDDALTLRVLPLTGRVRVLSPEGAAR
jgi:prepilin-type N-terminal cleavage/methylation domain-containing protein